MSVETHAERARKILDNTSAMLESASENVLHPAQVQGINTSADRAVKTAQVYATLAVADELREILIQLQTGVKS